MREVLGIELPVAEVSDMLQGKIWAALEAQGRPSNRRKDLLDIERLIEGYPELRASVPAELLQPAGLIVRHRPDVPVRRGVFP